MRQTLLAQQPQRAGEPEPASHGPDPVTLAKEKGVRRMLSRIGAVRSTRAGRRTSDEVEDVIWTIAERLDASVVEVGQVLWRFSDGDPDGMSEGICRPDPKCEECLLADECPYFLKRSPTIHDLPESERPRERLLAQGEDVLSDTELLALLIGEGLSGRNAVDLARLLLAKGGGLREMADMTTAEMKEITGIGDAKAARVQAAFALAKRYAATRLEPGKQFQSSRDIFLHYREELGHEKREIFTCVFLDTRLRYTGQRRISVGTLKASPVGPREVFRPAIRAAAHSVIFVHNHPSGDPTPSGDDLAITRRLIEVGKTIGISVLDHVIVGANDYYSMADNGSL